MRCKKSKILTLIFAFVLIVMNTMSTSVYAINADSIISNKVIGCVISEINNSVDLTQIKLDVYKLELLKMEDNKTEYKHVYQSTISPDSSGKIEFDRPSPYFFIEVNIESIPVNYGIDKSSFLISKTESSFEINVFKIANYKIDIYNESVDFCNENGYNIIVNSESPKKI